MTLNTCIKVVEVINSFMLVVIYEVTNFLITKPLYKGTSNEIGDALLNCVFCKQGSPSYLIFDEDQAFLSSVMQYIYKKLDIKIMTTSPYNHG